MHAIKGSWVGQTYALATSNDCGGKKSRIRRSKEERKEMVVSFIKKYQIGNDGNFPSLNLTHKEVGGSFYTVREIVREVIQENRVLGPAKLLQDEEKSDQSLSHYSWDTVPVDPESSPVEALNGSPFVLDQNHSPSREYHLMSNGVIAESGHLPVDDEEITKGKTKTAVENAQVDGPEVNNIQIFEMVETENGSLEVAASGVLANQIVELEAEASLEQSITDESDLLNGNYSEEMPSTLEESVPVELGKEGSFGLSSSEKLTLEEMEVDTRMGQLMDENSRVVAEKTMEKPFNDPEIQKNVEVVSASKSKIVEMANVAVKTFPLRPVIKSTYHIHENSGEVGELSVKEKGSEEPCVEVGNGSLFSKSTPKSGSSFSGNAKEVGNPTQPLPEMNTLTLDKNIEDLTDSSLRSSISPSSQTTVNSGCHLQTSADTSCNGKAGEVAGVVDSPSSILVRPMNGSLPSAGGCSRTSKNVRPMDGSQHSGSSEECGKAMLDRINIETWEGALAKQKVHPLVAIFKSFVDSVVKFWSE